jgi:hypothetical protein
MKYTIILHGEKVGVAYNKQHLKQLLASFSDKEGVTITCTKK